MPLCLITGGSACGKSTFAEGLLEACGVPRYYIAAMRPVSDWDRKRVARHRAAREGKNFITVEKYTDIGEIRLPEKGSALLECVCNLCANEMYSPDADKDAAAEKIIRDISALYAQCDTLFVITNEIGSDEPAGFSDYINAVGRINAALAERADCVYEVVCGIPLRIK